MRRQFFFRNLLVTFRHFSLLMSISTLHFHSHPLFPATGIALGRHVAGNGLLHLEFLASVESLLPIQPADVL